MSEGLTERDYGTAVTAILHGFWSCINAGAFPTAADLLVTAEKFAPLTDYPAMHAADVRKAKAELNRELAA